MKISERIRLSRRTDREIADHCGVAVPVAFRWRTGATSPNIRNVAALAEAIGCEPADLIPKMADKISGAQA